MNAIKTVAGNIYATPRGLKLGSKGRVLPAYDLMMTLIDKGVRRQVRKALRRGGRGDLACKSVRMS